LALQAGIFARPLSRRRAEKDPTIERIGANAVDTIFLNDFGWLFREQTISDYGIDAQVEVVENNEPTGKLIALQIKTGASYFRPKGENFVFYGELRHLEYWTRHSLPVFLVLHDPEKKLTPLVEGRATVGACDRQGMVNRSCAGGKRAQRRKRPDSRVRYCTSDETYSRCTSPTGSEVRHRFGTQALGPAGAGYRGRPTLMCGS
jgi:hypothetical protein